MRYRVILCALVSLAGCTGLITGGDDAPAGDDGGGDRDDAAVTAPADAGNTPVIDGAPGPDADDWSPPPDAEPPPPTDWNLANLTNFTSYPDPNSPECTEFSGCDYAGYFAFLNGQQSEAWVMSHNIAAVHSDFAADYALETLRLRDPDTGEQIDVVVYDLCLDSDCNGCCTQNSSDTGFLIDIEHFTAERFGTWHGIVEWVCLTCD